MAENWCRIKSLGYNLVSLFIESLLTKGHDSSFVEFAS